METQRPASLPGTAPSLSRYVEILALHTHVQARMHTHVLLPLCPTSCVTLKKLLAVSVLSCPGMRHLGLL